MKLIQYAFLSGLLLLNVNVFAQTKQTVYADFSGISVPTDWDWSKCQLFFPGYFHFPLMEGYQPTSAFTQFRLDSANKTAVASISGVYASKSDYFILYDQYEKAAAARLACNYTQVFFMSFKLPPSCAKQIPIGKTIYIKGKLSGNDPKSFQFTNLSCSIK